MTDDGISAKVFDLIREGGGLIRIVIRLAMLLLVVRFERRRVVG